MARQRYVETADGIRLAARVTAGWAPGVVFFCGFQSDMTGLKAARLEADCQSRGQAFLRFDYSGHGSSDGRFEDGTIGRWLNDCLAVIDQLTTGELIFVGSSMGGWLAILTALRRPERVAGLVGVAAAPDFTERLVRPSMTEMAWQILEQTGQFRTPSRYGGERVITQALLEEGRNHLILEGEREGEGEREVALSCPVRLIHGLADRDVPWQLSLALAEQITTADLRLCLVKDGDHRLSREPDLALLVGVVSELSATLGASSA